MIGGTKAFDEDDWSYIKIGDNVILHMMKPSEKYYRFFIFSLCRFFISYS